MKSRITSHVLYYGIRTIIVLITILIQPSFSIPVIGNCTDRLPDEPIDIRKLTGVWYELEGWSSLQEWSYKCTSLKIAHFFEMRSELTWTAIHRYTGKGAEKTFPLKAASDANDGKLVVDPAEFAEDHKKVQLQVLKTDYINWGVIWSCNNFKGGKVHSEMVWIITRAREPSEETQSAIEDALIKLHLEHGKLYTVPQSKCDSQPSDAEDN